MHPAPQYTYMKYPKSTWRRYVFPAFSYKNLPHNVGDSIMRLYISAANAWFVGLAVRDVAQQDDID